MIADRTLEQYLFCSYLEQNGLYSPTVVEGHNLESHSPSIREAQKVYHRSGAKSVSGDRDWLPLVNSLVDIGVVEEEAGEVSLSTGYWRIRLAEIHGYEPIFEEGGYSVPQLYLPSVNLATEHYIRYRNTDTVTQEDVADRIISTTRPEEFVGRADETMESLQEFESPTPQPERVLMCHKRFHTAVGALKRYEENLKMR